MKMPGCKEAERRGLANLRNTAEALPTYILPKNIEMLTRQGVYSSEEIFSRHEVHIEKYCKVIRIEAATLVDMVQHGILNAASEYEAALCSTIAAKRAAAPELACHVEILARQRRQLAQRAAARGDHRAQDGP